MRIPDEVLLGPEWELLQPRRSDRPRDHAFLGLHVPLLSDALDTSLRSRDEAVAPPVTWLGTTLATNRSASAVGATRPTLACGAGSSGSWEGPEGSPLPRSSSGRVLLAVDQQLGEGVGLGAQMRPWMSGPSQTDLLVAADCRTPRSIFARWARRTPLMSGPPGCSIDATAMTRSSARRGLELLLPLRQRVLDNAQIVPGEIVLDVGAGDGLIAFGGRWTGLGWRAASSCPTCRRTSSRTPGPWRPNWVSRAGCRSSGRRRRTCPRSPMRPLMS